MDKKIFFKWSLRDLIVAIGPVGFAVLLIVVAMVLYVDPAPPKRLTIATGDSDQSDLAQFAKEYAEILKEDGVQLEIKSTSNPFENLKALTNDNERVDAAFVPDGLGSMEKQPYVESLGSLYYQPVWIFYRGSQPITHIAELEGRKVSVGRNRHGTSIIAKRLLRLNGVNTKDNPNIVNLDAASAAEALKKGEIDAAFFILPPESPLILDLFLAKDIHILDNEQAEGLERNNPTFHHLVLARGAIDLKNDKPDRDIDMVGTTTTLLVRDDLHPAPKIYFWRLRQRIYRSYGELKHLETQIGPNPTIKEYEDFLLRLDAIEARVNKIRVPQSLAEYVYSLRLHIQLVRDGLSATAEKLARAQTAEMRA